MRHAFRRQRLAWAAVGLAMAAAAAGCSQATPTQASVPAVTQQTGASFKTQQAAWLAPALAGVPSAFVTPGTSALADTYGLWQWGRPFAAGYGDPLVLPFSNIWVGSGIQILTGTWPYNHILYPGM